MNDRIEGIGREQQSKQDKYGRPRYRHVASGGVYEIVAFAMVEATLEPVVVYRNTKTGATFTRPEAEFFDGRFEPVINAP